MVTGAHGVRGQVRIKAFTEAPEDLAAYGPLSDEDGGRQYRITVTGRSKDQLLARVAGVADRDAAAALKGTRLYVPRSALPAPQDEETFYHVDLIGLLAEDVAGRPLGRVVAVQDFGAGAIVRGVAGRSRGTRRYRRGRDRCHHRAQSGRIPADDPRRQAAVGSR